MVLPFCSRGLRAELYVNSYGLEKPGFFYVGAVQVEQNSIAAKDVWASIADLVPGDLWPLRPSLVFMSATTAFGHSQGSIDQEMVSPEAILFVPGLRYLTHETGEANIADALWDQHRQMPELSTKELQDYY